MPRSRFFADAREPRGAPHRVVRTARRLAWAIVLVLAAAAPIGIGAQGGPPDSARGTGRGRGSAVAESGRGRGNTVADTTTVPVRRAPFWPDSVRGPAPRPGAILPAKRIVAYYGNPRSTRMGILGQIPPREMFARLEQTVRAWEKADSSVGVQPALELITTVAQADSGRDGMYRLRMPEALIEQVYGWAKERGWILVLDVQVGRSSVQAELEPLRKFLMRPEVHLALDPEFDVKPHQRPGQVIGTMDADDINYASNLLGELVDQYQLPPKVLVVHRFTRPMVTRSSDIRLDPRVQVVMHMDGFGSPANKRASHEAYIAREPVQWVGFKLFYKNDKPLLSPSEVLKIRPVPLFISYQ